MSHAPSRRAFIAQAAALSAAGISLAAAGSNAGQDGPAATKPGAATPPATPAERPLNILFLGGTQFLGPPTVRRLIARGHTVTLFNRGRRRSMFPDLELLVGNRIPSEGPGLEPLREAVNAGRRWDAVIDTASVHTWTADAAEVLQGAVDHFLYISSLSAYASNEEPGQDETAALETMDDATADGITRMPYNMQYYGAVKARSEAAAERAFPGRTTVMRPGLIVGPGDSTHRFTYWPARVRAGGEVLAPGAADHPVQFIDVRDLADFMVRSLERQHFGIYNTNGPSDGPMPMGTVLDTCKRATGSDATFTWVEADWLRERGVNAWSQMPLWIPPAGGYAGFHTRTNAKAVAAGLKSRPLKDIVTDTLKWLDEDFEPTAIEQRGVGRKPGENAPGITRQREAELLAEWKKRAADDDSATGG